MNKSQVLALLDKIPTERNVQVTSDRATIRCPSHNGGQEQHNSLAINLSAHKNYGIGRWKCFACGIKGDFPELLGFFGIEGGTARVSFDDDVYDPRLSQEIDLYPDGAAVLEPWRGIKVAVLNSIEAKIIYDKRIKEMRLFLPVDIGDERIGAVWAGLVKKKGENSYINTKNFPSSKAFFPFNYTAKLLKRNNTKTIVIVEGPRDALRLCQNGIPALALLGATTWSDYKAELIECLNVTDVILALDNDEAGKHATKQIYRQIKDQFDVSSFEWDNKDACDASKKCLRELKGLL